MADSYSDLFFFFFSRPQTSHWKVLLLFICSTWTMHFQNILDTSEPRPKQSWRPEPRKHTKDPPLAILVFLTVFSTMRLFFEIFWLHQKVLPSIFWFFATEWMVWSPVYNFRQSEIFQNDSFSFQNLISRYQHATAEIGFLRLSFFRHYAIFFSNLFSSKPPWFLLETNFSRA